MTPAQQRKFWASANATWGRDGEYMAYSIMLARYGKLSTKALTQSEIEDLLDLFDTLEERFASNPASPAQP